MNLGRKTHAIIVGLACFGLLMQTTPSFAGPPVKAESSSDKVRLEEKTSTSPVTKKVVPPAPIDVAFRQDGVLSGRVLNADAKGAAQTEVTIRQGKMDIAKTVTDSEGRFQVANLKGGVYLVSANGGHGLFRFWTPKSAPPIAHNEVLVMSQAVVVRAQSPSDGGDVLYDDNGQPYARVHVVDNGAVATGEACPPVGADLRSLDIFTIALLGTAAAGLAIAIVALDDDDPAPATP